MKTLLLMRHGEAVENTPYTDKLRPLTDLGRQQAHAVGLHLQQKSCLPNLIYVSTAERTQQTCHAVTQDLSTQPTIEAHDSIYHADLDILQGLLDNTAPHINTLMIIGHNPSISHFANHLAKKSIPPFSPATCCALQFPVETWLAIASQSGTLAFER
ncbi:MAG: phosphoglycerate mutase [marine bacterium B5-7]|nr:MAG: phosphoglycerate mutase [marine bacterium B5-7]